jgi:hypothetical protein
MVKPPASPIRDLYASPARSSNPGRGWWGSTHHPKRSGADRARGARPRPSIHDATATCGLQPAVGLALPPPSRPILTSKRPIPTD